MTKYTINNSIIEKAKITNPIPFLELSGCYVHKRSSEKTGYVYLRGFTKIGDEDIRVTLKNDGHWVSCCHDNTPIGSNINLVLKINPNLNCVEAAKQLCQAAGIDTKPYFSRERLVHTPSNSDIDLKKNLSIWPPQSDKSPPVMPTETAIKEGISYLKRRGISEETIQFARKCKFLKFLADSIIFCGYDTNGVLRSATKRSTNIYCEESEKKRDLSGSIKAYAPVLPGNCDVVWIVEGGVDALAARDIALRKGINPPIVIVTGGRNTKTWIDNPSLQNMIQKAKRCYICLEGDQGCELSKTKNAIIAQRDMVLKKIGKDLIIWPENGKWVNGCKDIADLNLFYLNK
jgi:hypothetical protein